MIIKKDETIAGIPIVEVRAFLRLYRGDTAYDLRFIDEFFKKNSHDSVGIRDVLFAEGLIELKGEEGHFRTTAKGLRLSLSSLREYKRETALRHLNQLVKRAEGINESDRYAHYVTHIALFGSLLDPAREMVGDADVAVNVVPRKSDPKAQRKLEDDVLASHERPRKESFEEWYFLGPEFIVYRELRRGSRVVSVADVTGLPDTPFKVIYHYDPATCKETRYPL